MEYDYDAAMATLVAQAEAWEDKPALLEACAKYQRAALDEWSRNDLIDAMVNGPMIPPAPDHESEFELWAFHWVTEAELELHANQPGILKSLLGL